MLRHQAFWPELASLPKQVGADLALFELADEDAVSSASQQALQIGLRMDSGSRRRSSPSIASTPKAQSCTSSLCLPECRALKSEVSARKVLSCSVQYVRPRPSQGTLFSRFLR
jgi:hypothetical protein